MGPRVSSLLEHRAVDAAHWSGRTIDLARAQKARHIIRMARSPTSRSIELRARAHRYGHPASNRASVEGSTNNHDVLPALKTLREPDVGCNRLRRPKRAVYGIVASSGQRLTVLTPIVGLEKRISYPRQAPGRAGCASCGGVANAPGALKSNASHGASALASRLVSGGRFQRSSMRRKIEVWS